ENNRDVDIGVKTLYAIAEALGVSPLYLLGETEDPLHGIVESDDEDGIVFSSRLGGQYDSEEDDGKQAIVVEVDKSTGRVRVAKGAARDVTPEASAAIELLSLAEGLSERGRG